MRGASARDHGRYEHVVIRHKEAVHVKDAFHYSARNCARAIHPHAHPAMRPRSAAGNKSLPYSVPACCPLPFLREQRTKALTPHRVHPLPGTRSGKLRSFDSRTRLMGETRTKRARRTFAPRAPDLNLQREAQKAQPLTSPVPRARGRRDLQHPDHSRQEARPRRRTGRRSSCPGASPARGASR